MVSLRCDSPFRLIDLESLESEFDACIDYHLWKVS